MLVLGVESSCDETSVAIVKDGKEILANIILSQIDIHTLFGGVVPEVASRHHVANVSIVFKEAFKKANVSYNDIDLVAVTSGPGLIGSLLVGLNAAKAFALCFNKPIIGVNHLIGHIYSGFIEHDVKFPAICLLVSGGNTELIYMKDHYDFKILGETLDDACGEAYDKVARVLNIGYPGGPEVDRLAFLGKDTYKLPRVYLDKNSFDFSFSGLKSAVINLAHNCKQKNEEINKEDLCASFQNSVCEVLVFKALNAVSKYNVKDLIVCGGVSANKGLKKHFNECKSNELNLHIPSLQYCTDNAAMIAVAGYYYFSKYKATHDLNINADASLEFGDYDE
ncbi:MAG: tRNA (adenosine(37)-N6)-threonylcarbamoyltransferase complex transferase subunit TsaD [Anaeroplasmataceae bacterium]